MKHSLFAGLGLMFLAIFGCQGHTTNITQEPVQPSANTAWEMPSLFSNDLARDAQATYMAYVKAINYGFAKWHPEIPSAYWARRIRELKPLKVYTHRVNIVVVQKVTHGMETGKYIYIPISSHFPQPGKGGFEFSPKPKNNGIYTSEDGVLNFKSTVN